MGGSLASDLRTRLIKGVAASGFGQAVNVAVNLVQIPLFLALVGKGGLADWGLLSALPSQLAQSDLGFGTAAAAEMAQRVGREDRSGALRVFQSCWALVTVLSLTAAVAAALFLALAPWTSWFNISVVTPSEAAAISLILVAQVVAQQQMSLMAAAFKSDGLYARVTMAENFIRLAQFGFGFAILAAWPHVLGFAIGSAGAFILGTIWLAWDLRRQRPWVAWGWSHASWEEIKPLIRPALTFMAHPFALAINLQWFVMAINATLGPTAQLIWTTTRTLARVVIQLCNVLMGPTWVEFSTSFGKGDGAAAKRLFGSMLKLTVGASAVLALAIGLAGPWLHGLYTQGKVPYQADVFWLLLAAGVLTSLWSVPFTVAMSVNRHTWLTLSYFAANFIGLGAGWLLGGAWGLLAYGLGAVAAEALMAPGAFAKARQILASAVPVSVPDPPGPAP